MREAPVYVPQKFPFLLMLMVVRLLFDNVSASPSPIYGMIDVFIAAPSPERSPFWWPSFRVPENHRVSSLFKLRRVLFLFL